MSVLKLRIHSLMGLLSCLQYVMFRVKKKKNPKEGKVGSWLCKEVALEERLLMPFTEELF